MKIGIIFIATGKYYIFTKDLVESFNEFFLPDHEKKYFIFTDNKNPGITGENIHYLYKEKEEWPYDSLHRFKNIYQNKDMFNGLDFVFFSNANMKALRIVSSDILPSGDFDFSAVIHPGYYLASLDELPYERNRKSLSYVPYGEGENYYQGCLYGGKKSNFVEMCGILSDNIGRDSMNGTIASVIDESHLNRYLIGQKVMSISPVYAYPEQILNGSSEYSTCISYADLSKQDPIIIQKDKRSFGGHDFLRE